MRTRLSQRFELLVNRRAGKDMRHRSMHAVIQSSFHLLSPPLRRLFTQLSVFRGGWTLEAAEVVCCEDAMLDSLDRLCADSLIVAEEIEGEMRFRMLETLREFAAEQLAEPERWAVARRHVVYCIAFANEASRHLKESDEAVWLGRLERELDNLRAAFDACRLDPQGGEPGMRLAHSLHRFWITRGPLREGRQRVAAALEHAGAQEVTPERADALYTLGGLALMQDDYALARDLTEQALELAQQVGHRRGIAQALSNLGSVAYYQADLDRSEVLNRRSLELNREIGNEHGVNVALHNLAIIAEHRYDYRAARALYAQSLALAMQLGNSQGIASAHSNLGNIARRQNEIPEAKTHFAQSLAIQRDLGNKVGIAIALTQMGTVLASERDYEAARAYYVEALSLYREQGIRRGLATALSNLGDLEYEMGRVEEARALQEESLALYRDLNSRDGVVAVLLHLGQTLTRSGDFERSRQCLEECLQLSRPAGHHLFVTESLKALAALAVSQSHWELAAWYYGAAEAGREPLDCPLSPEQQEELAAAYALLCTKLTDQGFSRAFAAGRAAPLNRITMFGPG
jgi:tetratricopeptide (TPR) repeat protein